MDNLETHLDSGPENNDYTDNRKPSVRRNRKTSATGYNSRLNVARSRRKQVDNDARLLQNRIALLKLEEHKAWKRIVKTKSRAKQFQYIHFSFANHRLNPRFQKAELVLS